MPKRTSQHLDGVTPSVLAEMVSFITGNETAERDGAPDKALRQRIELFLNQVCASDSAEVVTDMRRLNKSKTIYDNFWSAADAYMRIWQNMRT